MTLKTFDYKGKYINSELYTQHITVETTKEFLKEYNNYTKEVISNYEKSLYKDNYELDIINNLKELKEGVNICNETTIDFWFNAMVLMYDMKGNASNPEIYFKFKRERNTTLKINII